MSKKGKVVICPVCRTNAHVYLANTYERRISILGGGLGLMGMICSLPAPPQAQPIRLVFKAISAALAGASLGKKAGENIDNYIVPRYKCAKCQIIIKENNYEKNSNSSNTRRSRGSRLSHLSKDSRKSV